MNGVTDVAIHGLGMIRKLTIRITSRMHSMPVFIYNSNYFDFGLTDASSMGYERKMV